MSLFSLSENLDPSPAVAPQPDVFVKVQSLPPERFLQERSGGKSLCDLTTSPCWLCTSTVEQSRPPSFFPSNIYSAGKYVSGVVEVTSFLSLVVTVLCWPVAPGSVILFLMVLPQFFRPGLRLVRKCPFPADTVASGIRWSFAPSFILATGSGAGVPREPILSSPGVSALPKFRINFPRPVMMMCAHAASPLCKGAPSAIHSAAPRASPFHGPDPNDFFPAGRAFFFQSQDLLPQPFTRHPLFAFYRGLTCPELRSPPFRVRRHRCLVRREAFAPFYFPFLFYASPTGPQSPLFNRRSRAQHDSYEHCQFPDPVFTF